LVIILPPPPQIEASGFMKEQQIQPSERTLEKKPIRNGEDLHPKLGEVIFYIPFEWVRY